jgi:hypothetical protein
MLGGGIGFRLPKSVVSHSSTNHFFFSLPVLLSLRSFLCINKFLCPRPGPETSPSGSPWWLAPLYRRPSADDRRGFPKPGRCIKHNHHGVFPVGLTQSCGSPVSIVCFLLRACWVSFRKTSRPLSFNVFESSKKKYQNIYLKKKLYFTTSWLLASVIKYCAQWHDSSSSSTSIVMSSVRTVTRKFGRE